MRNYIKFSFLGLLIGGTYLINLGFAKYGVWGLNDINILSREERGADDSMLYSDNSIYKEYDRKESELNKYLSGLKETNYEQYLKKTEGKRKTAAINEYLENNFLEQVSIDNVVKYKDGNELWRPFKFKNTKTKIVIHHTTNDISKLTGEDSAKDLIKSVYRYHAFTRGWGDIGYNFVIDPYGNIYEGRSGGQGVVGAHAVRNNVDSIGISLMGNFEVQEPTFAQIQALTKLMVSLAKKYKINPMTKQTYHIETSEKPYIKDVIDYSIVGHKDAGKTSCPGKFLYQRLPELRSLVLEKLNEVTLVSDKLYQKVDVNSSNNAGSSSSAGQSGNSKPQQTVIKTFNSSKKYTAVGSLITIKDKVSLSGFDANCTIDSSNIKVNKCSYENGVLSVILEYKKYFASGNRTITIGKGNKVYKYKFQIVWYKDLDGVLEQRKTVYKSKYGLPNSTNSMEKIKDKISAKQAKEMINSNIKVLLYEISASYNSWEFQCEKGCKVSIDNQSFNAVNSLKLTVNDEYIDVEIDGAKSTGKSKIVITNQDIIKIRSNGTELGEYRGNMIIQKDKINILNGGVKEQFVIVNDVAFDSYMRGTGEISEKQTLDKIKVMSLLIKGYVLFYLKGTNPHPSLPSGAGYSATDDPRSFQKYIGVRNEKVANKWLQALEETKNEIILYNGYLPILPYYHCSAGFTLSGLEKYGWTDTPFLKSKIDFHSCEKFSGHGVGLSGQGAEFLAKKGWNYKQIIQYYYEGLSISKF